MVVSYRLLSVVFKLFQNIALKGRLYNKSKIKQKDYIIYKQPNFMNENFEVMLLLDLYWLRLWCLFFSTELWYLWTTKLETNVSFS